jgi:hypothetical protein
MASCPEKNGRGKKYLSRPLPNHSRLQTGKIADLALWPNAISEKAAYA